MKKMKFKEVLRKIVLRVLFRVCILLLSLCISPYFTNVERRFSFEKTNTTFKVEYHSQQETTRKQYKSSVGERFYSSAYFSLKLKESALESVSVPFLRTLLYLGLSVVVLVPPLVIRYILTDTLKGIERSATLAQI